MSRELNERSKFMASAMWRRFDILDELKHKALDKDRKRAPSEELESLEPMVQEWKETLTRLVWERSHTSGQLTHVSPVKNL